MVNETSVDDVKAHLKEQLDLLNVLMAMLHDKSVGQRLDLFELGQLNRDIIQQVQKLPKQMDTFKNQTVEIAKNMTYNAVVKNNE